MKSKRTKKLASLKKVPNKLTQKTIDDARQGKGLAGTIKNVREFMRLI